MLFIALLGIIKYLAEEGYYSMSKWDQFSTGISGIMSRILLIFEVIGYVSVLCYSVFCLLLVFKKRDISVRYLKGYFLFAVGFLFMDYMLQAILKRELSSYDMEQFIKAVIAAVIWTYYLNVSTRVKETFVVPYPN